MICVRFFGQKMKTYFHIGGWWILCETHPVEVQNALTSIWATYAICPNYMKMWGMFQEFVGFLFMSSKTI